MAGSQGDCCGPLSYPPAIWRDASFPYMFQGVTLPLRSLERTLFMLLASSYLCRGLLGRLKGLWCGHIFIILGAIFLVGPQIFTHTCGLSGKLLIW